MGGGEKTSPNQPHETGREVGRERRLLGFATPGTDLVRGLELNPEFLSGSLLCGSQTREPQEGLGSSGPAVRHRSSPCWHPNGQAPPLFRFRGLNVK